MSGKREGPIEAHPAHCSLLTAHRCQMGADRAWWSGRSSKPRWRRLRLLRWVRFPHAPAIWVLGAGLLGAGNSLPAQAPAPSPQPRDTSTQQPAPSSQLRPLPAFFHSLLIPGWAQSKLDRKLTAGLFVAWEGLTLGMALKADGEVKYLRRTYPDSSARVIDKQKERQDWLILLAFNHLFAGLEAFVSSQLQDFPADVKFRAAPRGIGVQAAVPFRLP